MAIHARRPLFPFIIALRGTGRLLVMGRQWWTRTPSDRRNPLVALAVCGATAGWLLPYGPHVATAGLAAFALWHGRGDGPPGRADGAATAEEHARARRERLRRLYEALVPAFQTDAPSPDGLYTCGGSFEPAFLASAFNEHGRITRLRLRYPVHFPDGDEESKHRIERLLAAKSGRDREFRFAWHEEDNLLDVTALEPLPADIRAQRFVTGPGEIVLGFTDPGAVERTMPVVDAASALAASPVVWRTGDRSATPHLLVVGEPGAGASSLLRSIAVQALRHGADVLLIDGGGTGEFSCFSGCQGVVSVESSLAGAITSLDWASRETERRLLKAGQGPAIGSDERPLWIVCDRLVPMSHLASVEGTRDPQELLEVALRHGRGGRVTVVIAEQSDSLGALCRAAWETARARVVLGTVSGQHAGTVLGATPPTTPVREAPPGRGYARLGSGPAYRLQVPATPDPYDDAGDEKSRQAVLDLLPDRAGPQPPPAAHMAGQEDSLR